MLCLFRGWLPPIRHSVSYIFAASMGILNSYARHNPQHLSPMGTRITTMCFGRDKQPRNKLERWVYSKLWPDDVLSSSPDLIRENGWFDVICGCITKLLLGYGLFQTLTLLGTFRLGREKAIAALRSTHQNSLGFGLFFSVLGFETGLRLILKYFRKDEIKQWQSRNSQKQQDPPGPIAQRFPPLYDFVTGTLAGLAMLQWSSTPISMYTLALALHAVTNHKIAPLLTGKASILPLLYGISTSIQLYCVQFENDTLREGAKDFLAALAGGQPAAYYKELSSKLQKICQLPVKPADWWF